MIGVMSALENKQLLQNIFARMAEGDSRLLVESMADDFRWIVSGATNWSGTYEGKQKVLTELFAPLRSRIVDRIRTTAQRFIAEDDLVVVEARGNNLTRCGMRYDNTYCFVFRLANGKLSEVTEYMDTDLAVRVLGEPGQP
jgi:uncharacterized protein